MGEVVPMCPNGMRLHQAERGRAAAAERVGLTMLLWSHLLDHRAAWERFGVVSLNVEREIKLRARPMVEAYDPAPDSA